MLVGGTGELNSWTNENNAPSIINGMQEHFSKPYSFLFSDSTKRNQTSVNFETSERKMFEFSKIVGIVLLYILNISQFIIFSDSTEIFEVTLLLIVMQIMHGMVKQFEEINKMTLKQSFGLTSKQFYETKSYGLIVQQVCLGQS